MSSSNFSIKSKFGKRSCRSFNQFVETPVWIRLIMLHNTWFWVIFQNSMKHPIAGRNIQHTLVTPNNSASFLSICMNILASMWFWQWSEVSVWIMFTQEGARYSDPPNPNEWIIRFCLLEIATHAALLLTLLQLKSVNF